METKSQGLCQLCDRAEAMLQEMHCSSGRGASLSKQTLAKFRRRSRRVPQLPRSLRAMMLMRQEASTSLLPKGRHGKQVCCSVERTRGGPGQRPVTKDP